MPDHEDAASDKTGHTPSVFTRIISGELPGRFVWRDDLVVAMLTIAPINPGHTMVVPIEQIDRWSDVPLDLWTRVAVVQHHVGVALQQAFRPARVGVMILGMEVPHCHVHLVPIDHESELSFAHADPDPLGDDLDAAAEDIREALRSAGHTDVVGQRPTRRERSALTEQR